MQRTADFPTVGVAFWITLLAILSFAVIDVAAGSAGARELAEALGLVLGFGVVGTLAARQVPPPQADRLGLRGIRLRFLLPLLLLIPVVLLANELDNLVRMALSQPQGSEIAAIREKLSSAGALEVLEGVIVAIGIQPVVSEWFYRGVLQQGLISQLGAGRGIVITALLYALSLYPLALSQGGVGISFVLWLAATLGGLVTGVAYGLARHYSGSLLAPILLHVALNASANLALGFAARLPIPGFNTAGAHTPIQFVIPAAASVALGTAFLVRLGGSPRPFLHPTTTADKGQSAPPR